MELIHGRLCCKDSAPKSAVRKSHLPCSSSAPVLASCAAHLVSGDLPLLPVTTAPERGHVLPARLRFLLHSVALL